MAPMALVVLGLFVLVWIISAVVKATQSANPPNRQAANRPRPNQEQRVERTSDTDIDRFMAEIDRLRRKGEGLPAGRGPQQAPRPVADRPASRPEPRPRPVADRRERERERERRPRPSVRPAPPPLPAADSVPVLRPIQPETVSTSGPAAPMAPAAPPAAKLARLAKMAGPTGPEKPSPVLVALQSVLKSKQGPAAALILAEIFGEPPGKRAMMGGKRS
jgi:hypothetical protein